MRLSDLSDDQLKEHRREQINRAKSKYVKTNREKIRARNREYYTNKHPKVELTKDQIKEKTDKKPVKDTKNKPSAAAIAEQMDAYHGKPILNPSQMGQLPPEQFAQAADKYLKYIESKLRLLRSQA